MKPGELSAMQSKDSTFRHGRQAPEYRIEQAGVGIIRSPWRRGFITTQMGGTVTYKIVAYEDGKPTTLFEDPRTWFVRPVPSPDERYIAVSSSPFHGDAVMLSGETLCDPD